MMISLAWAMVWSMDDLVLDISQEIRDCKKNLARTRFNLAKLNLPQKMKAELTLRERELCLHLLKLEEASAKGVRLPSYPQEIPLADNVTTAILETILVMVSHKKSHVMISILPTWEKGFLAGVRKGLRNHGCIAHFRVSEDHRTVEVILVAVLAEVRSARRRLGSPRNAAERPRRAPDARPLEKEESPALGRDARRPSTQTHRGTGQKNPQSGQRGVPPKIP